MIKKLLLILFSAFALHQTVADNPLQYLEERYKELSPKAQFATTAAIGFVGTRIALNTAVSVLKFGALAFVTTEILHHTGALKNLRKEHEDIMENVKNQVLRQADTFRGHVHRHLSPDSLQSFFEKERIGAFGMATGVVLGTLI